MVAPLVLSELVGLTKIVIDKLWPDKSEQEREQLAAAVAAVQGQLEVNKEEAKSPSMFVAGWRPGSGWICNIGLLYTFIIQPLGAWIATVKGWPTPPKIDTDTLMFLLTSLLGIGGFRTIEKIKKVA